MAIDIVPKSLYPFVPQAAGVPNLLRTSAQIFDSATFGYLNVSGALDDIIGSQALRFGVFDTSGKLFAEYDSFFASEYTNSARTSDYPVEQGTFATYNKVDNGFDINVTLKCGGSDLRRANFIAACEYARSSLQTYTVITDVATYQNVNFQAIRIVRAVTDGVQVVTVELGGHEVRAISTATYSQGQSASGYSLENVGTIQTVDDPGFDASGVV